MNLGILEIFANETSALFVLKHNRGCIEMIVQVCIKRGN